jgi:uncharacterized protein YbcI
MGYCDEAETVFCGSCPAPDAGARFPDRLRSSRWAMSPLSGRVPSSFGGRSIHQESAKEADMAADDTRHERVDGENARLDHTMRDISKAMVKIYKEQFGRGPETVWTRHCGPDIIVSVICNSLTPVERTMLAMGEEARLRDIRVMFQHATEAHFRETVEDITGRRVIGFMSGIDVHNDLSSEVFTLGPYTSLTQ